MPATMDEALCVRQWDWSETSQTVTLLCRNLGLVRGLAKGSKRATHPYSGGVELLTRGHVGVIPRPNSELALITEWDLQETFPSLRRSLTAHYVGLYIGELVQHAVHDHDPHRRLYEESLIALRSLDDAVDQNVILTRFQWALLADTGYKPELEHSVSSGEPLREMPWYDFNPQLGGLVHTGDDESAPETGDEATGGPHWRIRRETVDLLRAVQARLESGASTDPKPARPAEGRGAVPVQAFARAARFLAAYARYVFGREPKMMTTLFGHKLPR